MAKVAQERPGEAQSAADGRGQEHPLWRLVKAVQEAEKLRRARKLDQARSACAAVLKEDPDYVAALFTMGLILADQGQFERALGYLHRAIMFNPQDTQILTGLSGVYLKLNSNLMAARTLEQARKNAPDDANILITLGEIYREEKEYELSKDAYEAALAIEPGLLAAELGLALNLSSIGHLAEAAPLFEKPILAGSRSLSCLYHLSHMPESLVHVDVMSLLDEAKPAPRQSMDAFRVQLGFTKAAAFDKAGRYEDAWREVRRARRYNTGESRRIYKQHRARHAPLLELARTAELEQNFKDELASKHPISLFIVGPSRSGKTTLERLVGSLPGVKRGYENPIVENAVRRCFQTAGFPTRSVLVQLPPGLGDMFRTFYLEELDKRAGSAKVLTNTLPHRTEDALRVASEIPNARFVFIKRNIDDLTIRIFMRSYAQGNHYSSDINDIRDHLEWHHEMIDASAARLPDMARVIAYEDMVADPAGAVAKVAELCGLEVPDMDLPPTGDDRGCAEPYLDHISSALKS